MRVTVVVPTYNEADNIERLLPTGPRARCRTRDDPRRRRQQPRRHGRPRRASSASELGGDRRAAPARPRPGSARRTATGFARGARPAAPRSCVQMDADLSHDPAVLPALVADRRARCRPRDRQPLRAGRAITENWPWRRRCAVAVGQPLRRRRARSGGQRRHRRLPGLPRRGPASGWTSPRRGRRLRLPGRDDATGSCARRPVVEFPITFRDRTARRVEDVERDRREALGLVHPARACPTALPAPPAPPRSADRRRRERLRHVRARRRARRRTSSTSTWTRSSRPVELLRRPGAARASPSSSAAPGRAASWPRRRTRPARYGVHSAHAVAPGPPAAARTPCSCPATTRCTRGQRRRSTRSSASFTPLVEPLVARRGVPRRHRRACGCSATGRRSAPAIRGAGRATSCGCAARSASPRTSSSPSWRRRRPSRGATPDGRRARAGRRRGAPGERAGVPAPAARSSALWGVGPATLARLRPLRRRARSATSPRSARPTLDRRARRGPRPHLHAPGLGRRRPAGRARPGGRSRSATRRPSRPTAHPRRAPRRDRAPGRRRRRRGCGARRVAARTVTLKVRFADFRTITRSATLAARRRHGPATLLAAATRLLDGVDPTPGVRLLGVSASQLRRRRPSS